MTSAVYHGCKAPNQTNKNFVSVRRTLSYELVSSQRWYLWSLMLLMLPCLSLTPQKGLLGKVGYEIDTMLIFRVKMPTTIVGILTFMSKMNFMLHSTEQKFYNLVPSLSKTLGWLDGMFPSVFRLTSPHRREWVVLGHMVKISSQTMCQNIVFY